MTAPHETSRGPDRIATAVLVAGLLLGLTRLFRLGEWSLWLDEVLTLADSLHGDRTGQKNPLGYAVFGFLYGLVDGRPDELALRLPAAAFGWLSLPLTWWAFARFVGRRAAAVAVLLLAASSWHAYWSQNARFYTLAQCLGLVGGGLFLRGLERDSLARIVGATAVLVAGYLTHASVALLAPALVGAPLVTKLLRRPVPGSSGRVVRFLVLLAVVGAIAAFGKVSYDLWYWRAVKGGGSPVHLALTAGFYFTPLLGAGALVGAGWAWMRRDGWGLFVVAVTAIVLVEAALLSFSVRVSAQYLFVLLPWFALAAALPFRPRSTAGDGSGEPLVASDAAQLAHVALLVLPALTSLMLYHTVRQGERPRWRAAHRLVHGLRGDDDLILSMQAPVAEYYLSAGSTDVRNLRTVAYLDEWRAGLPGKWARHDRPVWFVVNHEEFEDWPDAHRARVQETLETECRLVASFPLVVESRDLSVYVYRRD